MRWVHRVILSAFSKPEENADEIREGIIALVPFNMEEAKIQLQEQKAQGFNERVIKIFNTMITKESHTNDFLQFLLEQLNDEQKKLLIFQAESRLDPEFDYFIRIDKNKWIKSREMRLTDSGECFHIKLSLAVYPKKKETAMQLIERLFSQKNI